MHQNHEHYCAAVCHVVRVCVGALVLSVLACRGFHTDSEALYGVGDRGRHNRPEIIEPVTSGRLFKNSPNNRFRSGRFSVTKTGLKNRLKHRKSVSVPNTAFILNGDKI